MEKSQIELLIELLKNEIDKLEDGETVIRELTETELNLSFELFQKTKDLLKKKEDLLNQCETLQAEVDKTHTNYWAQLDNTPENRGVRFCCDSGKFVLVEKEKATEYTDEDTEDIPPDHRAKIREIHNILTSESLSPQEQLDAISVIVEPSEPPKCMGFDIRNSPLPFIPSAARLVLCNTGLNIEIGSKELTLPFESNAGAIIPLLKTFVLPGLKKLL